MQFIETMLPGVLQVESDVLEDARGAFIRAWMPGEFAAHGLTTGIAQCSIACNRRRGTVRGMHWQSDPMWEEKTIRVTRGAIYDVAVDLRPDSPTYCRWFGIELSADNRRMLYIPRGCAHGYQTLTDDTEVFYFVSKDYSPSHQRGARYNDPLFGIVWPLGEPTVINERDANYPDFVR